MTTHTTLRSPAELLAVVPYILGYHPTNSVVLMCLRNHQLGLTQRLDLPQPDQVHKVVPALLPSLLAESPDRVLLIGYEDHAGDSLPAFEPLSVELASQHIEIADRIVVCNGRWRSLDCDNEDCCPSEGSPVPAPSDVPRAVVEFVGEGIAPHPDREALASQLEPGPEAVGRVRRSAKKAMARAVESHSTPRAELFAAWPRILAPDAKTISPEDAVKAAMSLLDIEIRDGLVAWLSPGTLNINELSAEVQELICGLERGWGDDPYQPAALVAQNGVQDRLIHLCAMLPDRLAAPALSVLASFAWWRGDGALARVSLDRALRCEPNYRLARLLEHMVDLAIRPVGR
jgi:Domain of unknown function (DUF4192)